LQPTKTLQREQLRATLVVGLVASVIALKLYLPETFSPKVSLLAGVLLLYWFLYAVFTAYGIPENEEDKTSNWLVWAGRLSFRFGLYAGVIGVLLFIFLEKIGFLVVLEWSYYTVWAFTIVTYFGVELSHLVQEAFRTRHVMPYVRREWRGWLVTLVISLPLLVIHFRSVIF
jgi:hypothetical protein